MMKLRTHAKIIPILLGAMGLAVAANPANALTMNAQWFTVSVSDPDFYAGTTGNPGGAYNGPYGQITNFVQSGLGANGMPVYNTGATMGGQPVPQDQTAAHELTWWNPALNVNVVAAGTSIITLPINDSSVFPPQGTGSSDNPLLQTAIFTGILNVPVAETVTFNIGSDDDAFLYVDGQVVAQNGGIHDQTTVSFTTGLLSLGNHTITLFYADRNENHAILNFSVATQNVGIDAQTPLPGALPLFVSGLGALGVMGWRRKKKAATAA
jgi:fibro-slime domain-containing protein